jgi:hypothetical protein
MKHLTEEQLVLAYYGDVDRDVSQHLKQCPECQIAFARERRLLADLPEYAIPERGENYGAEVWTKLHPRLPKPRPQWRFWWTLAPAFAALLVVSFFAGRLAERQNKAQGFSTGARDRVLLITMGNHLDRSQILLAELVNAKPGTIDFIEERARAADLLDENRLLRVAAAHNGEASTASLLDDLERVFLDVSHSPANPSEAELEEIDGLLFKVRIINSNIQEKREKL